MKTLFIILLVVVLISATIYVSTKFFKKFKDEDGDGIPDIVEDKVEEIKNKVVDTTKEVKRRTKRVKEELSDVKKSAKDLGKQVGDVAKAVKGENRRGRKPKKK